MIKKISLAGNLGNCTYWYAKFLREAGFDVALYITFKKYDKNKKPLIMFGQDPRNEDAALKGEFPDWIKFFHVYSLKNILNIRKEFDQYDLNIAFESLPILLQFSSKPLITFATGSSLREQVFDKSIKGYLLKRGFLKSKAVLFDNVDMVTLECLKRLKIRNNRWIPDYLPKEIPIIGKSALSGEQLSGFKEKFFLFYPSRLDFDHKGTNILIKEFAEVLKKYSGLIRLFLIDYGKDSLKTKKLIESLKIQDSVTIFPVLETFDFIKLIRFSSACLGYFKNDEFGVHHYPFSIMKPLNLGKICISSIDQEAFEKIIGSVPPVLQVFKEEDVRKQIIFAFENYENLKKEFSVDGPQWVDKYHSKEIIKEKLLKIVQE